MKLKQQLTAAQEELKSTAEENYKLQEHLAQSKEEVRNWISIPAHRAMNETETV